ncbi:MAG: hypothetical protein J0G95_12575 [Rhizobiales bacterium]|nr:hypothetical protein [Hyphomicrobiales bacterium]
MDISQASGPGVGNSPMQQTGVASRYKCDNEIQDLSAREWWQCNIAMRSL